MSKSIPFTQSGEIGRYQTRAIATASKISYKTFPIIEIMGYAAAGDCAPHHYRYISAQPSHSGYFTDAAGSYWELVETEVDPRFFGAKADATTFNTASTTVSSNVVNVSGVTFTSADIGKYIGIQGAGAATYDVNYLTISRNPVGSDASYFILNGVTVTWVTSGATGNQVNMGVGNEYCYVHKRQFDHVELYSGDLRMEYRARTTL